MIEANQVVCEPQVHQAQPLSIDYLQVVFKIAERCNINCDYCYYFNMGDVSALDRPPRVSLEVATGLASWLANGCRELGIKRLSISFHGGEPMLLNSGNFDAICSAFTAQLHELVDLRFNIQTNGTILSEKWLSVLCKHSVHVGVSLDGDKAAHDRHRLDRRGHSTFEKTEANLQLLLKTAQESHEQIGPATISVLDSRNDYTNIYNYLRGLGLRRMSFLLPDRNFDDGFIGIDDSARNYGKCLFQIFEAWMTEDDPSVYVRFIHEALQHFQTWEQTDTQVPYDEQSLTDAAGNNRATQIIILHSDGVVAVDDSLIPALEWYKKARGRSFIDSSLREFLMDDMFDEIEEAKRSLSEQCQACKWKRICGGGDLENRFSLKNGFDNPSVYCDGYKFFYQSVCDLLVENGYPAERIRASLLH